MSETKNWRAFCTIECQSELHNRFVVLLRCFCLLDDVVLAAQMALVRSNSPKIALLDSRREKKKLYNGANIGHSMTGGAATAEFHVSSVDRKSTWCIDPSKLWKYAYALSIGLSSNCTYETDKYAVVMGTIEYCCADRASIYEGQRWFEVDMASWTNACERYLRRSAQYLMLKIFVDDAPLPLRRKEHQFNLAELLQAEEQLKLPLHSNRRGTIRKSKMQLN